jgi:hypothetical protein
MGMRLNDIDDFVVCYSEVTAGELGRFGAGRSEPFSCGGGNRLLISPSDATA